MYLKLGSINIWPNRAQVQTHMPASMKIMYPHVKYIIDYVEFKVSVPTQWAHHSQATLKQRCTKVLSHI